MVCVAQDFCKDKAVEEPIIVKKLLELSDSKTEHLPGLVPLVPGMPVILTQNIGIELGLINGMNGIFRQLVFDTNSVSTDSLSTTFSMNTTYELERQCYRLSDAHYLLYPPILLQLIKLPKDTDDIAAIYVP
ncbi:unnamed protein product [Adineta ricciae]|uniref:Uncharacterized protein n=1 Tax=Adineta ricciae TaxID=249248 RepID=A0A816ABM3_ADIRI|nr:unnamed protein product [Adineta ricciae]